MTDLGPKCLQRLSEDNTSRQRVNETFQESGEGNMTDEQVWDSLGKRKISVLYSNKSLNEPILLN